MWHELQSHLVKITKEWEDSAVFYASLKSGNRVVTAFIKMLPVLSRCFKPEQQTVNPILRQFQVRTVPHPAPSELNCRSTAFECFSVPCWSLSSCWIHWLRMSVGVQASTRTLQHICAHGKVQQDKKMVAIVPSVKKNLEMLLYKVLLSARVRVHTREWNATMSEASVGLRSKRCWTRTGASQRGGWAT